MPRLLERFARTVTIDASPERFVFSYSDRTLALEPTVWLQGDRILAAGAAGPPGARCVALFGDGPLPAERDCFDLLSAFLEHGIVRVLRRRVFIRPVVRFTGLSSFESLLSGYQRGLFARALDTAPVSDVFFEEGR